MLKEKHNKKNFTTVQVLIGALLQIENLLSDHK